MNPRTRLIAIPTFAAAAALTVAACGTSSSGTSSSTSPSGTTMNASAPFGPGCSAVPTSGPGSVAEMAKVPVGTAAASNPLLTTLATQATAAGLVDTLNNAKDITVFAPTNDAFAKVPAATLQALTKDPTGALASVLKYHVVAGTLTPSNLAGTHKTLEGQSITVTGSGESFTVNGSAQVVCGNVKTANATVYVIDGVLVPPAK